MKIRHLMIVACLALAAAVGHAADTDSGLKKRFSEIVIPRFSCEDASVKSAIAVLRQLAKDTKPEDPAPNIVCTLPSEKDVKVTISLNNIPLSEGLRYVAMAAGLELTYEKNAAVIAYPNRDDLSCNITVSPAKEANRYLVKFQLFRGDDALSSPTLNIPAGNEGRIQIGSDSTTNIEATAIVTQAPDGSSTAKTTFKYTEQGKPSLTFNHEVTLSGSTAEAPKQK